MGRLILVRPSMEHKEMVLDYKQEFLKHDESMDGTAGLRNCDSYSEWLDALRDNASEETVREGLVPATSLLAMTSDGKTLVGMIDIRHRLNDYLLQVGGHIGYSVRRSERRKGYATEMLALGLEVCKDLGIERILVTCDKDNIGSAKTILNNGGVLDNEVTRDGKVVQRYWFETF